MGGRGGAGGAYAGVSVNIGGKQKVYFLRNGKLQDSQTLKFMPGDGVINLKKIVTGGGKPLSAQQVREMTKSRAEKRTQTPDYELGNPFRERGKKKSVYRPRRRK